MTSWKDQLKNDPLPWLLEDDPPGVRYLALRGLLDYPQDDSEMIAAREAAYHSGPIATLLANLSEDGYWVEPGPGYYPKYTGTVWSLITLAQLGASIQFDDRLELACNYALDNALTEGGHFTMTGAPSGTIDCLQGNLCAALVDLDCKDPRLDIAYEWMARSVTGEGIAPQGETKAPRRYYAGQCGPTFACGANNKLPCAWGGVKVMLALGKLPADQRTTPITDAITQGVDFLFSVDPASAKYPSGWSNKPSRNWWKFGFPVFYVTDLLQILEALVGLGFGADERLTNALKLVLDKQDDQGRWVLEYDYAGKIWGDFGAKKQPNKWVTLRAMRVLKQAIGSPTINLSGAA